MLYGAFCEQFSLATFAAKSSTMNLREGKNAITRADVQWIKGLRQAGEARKQGLFVAEGGKIVTTLLEAGLRPERLYVQAERMTPFYQPYSPTQLSLGEMQRLSGMDSAPAALGVFPLPTFAPRAVVDGVTLMLDGVQDPGNLGAIVRTAAWFGVREVICSTQCARIYTPKAVQGSMGALAYLPVRYTDLEDELTRWPAEIPIYAAVMGATTDYRQVTCTAPCAILLGSEGHGLNPNLLPRVQQQISIPLGPNGHGESLNVAAAAALLCGWATR